MKPVIFGLSGTTLTDGEMRLFSEHQPAGYILFKRNCVDKAQVKALTDALKKIAGTEKTLILIDQEGGRVTRLMPPEWRKPPAAKLFADLYLQAPEKARALTYLNARLIAAELREVGITGNCAPLADIPAPGSHDIIGDRAFGRTPEQVTDLAGIQARGLMEGGIIPVLKHIPGHGRATADSHERLPTVETPANVLKQSDFVPFQRLANLPYGMTAHIRYTAIDADQPATLSPKVIRMIRDDLGFHGILMTDDLSMKALSGDLGMLAKQSLAAGCDLILHCNGEFSEMKSIADALGPIAPPIQVAMSMGWARLATGLPDAATEFADLSNKYNDMAGSLDAAAVA
ncbi:MAG: beta-N-acetylhexosaminidase [Rickettsiales bacterium]